VAPSKAITDFVRVSRIMTIKGGVLENSVVSARDIEELATMPSRDELLGKLLGLMNSPIQGLVNVLSGPSRSFVQVVNAYAQKQGEGAESAA
jgi:large subunit ribosomal protein L10